MWKEFSIYNIYITNSFPFIYSPPTFGGGRRASIPAPPHPPSHSPHSLSLVVEGFVCINKWGEVWGGCEEFLQPPSRLLF
jgi:hypothetical protein